MARIEIPMEEYQGMKEKIESLERKLADTNKEVELYKEKYHELQHEVEDISEVGVFTRIFSWKKLFKDLVNDNE